MNDHFSPQRWTWMGRGDMCAGVAFFCGQAEPFNGNRSVCRCQNGNFRPANTTVRDSSQRAPMRAYLQPCRTECAAPCSAFSNAPGGLGTSAKLSASFRALTSSLRTKMRRTPNSLLFAGTRFRHRGHERCQAARRRRIAAARRRRAGSRIEPELRSRAIVFKGSRP